ncbi:MAG: LysM peptidoglycan-binding domain-containing protein [Clostridia bacterium]|nr:LysM peptidoglycan-binding domain-containing protein [Clostridia bacterium]
MEIYRTEKNETLYDVANRFTASPVKLAIDNEIENPRRLAEGRELLIQMPTRTYIAKRGDTLERIALRFGVDEERLKAQNTELSGGGLYQGQPLYIKTSSPIYGMGAANGYLFAGYTYDNLMRAMPYLNYVTVCCAVSEGGRMTMLFDDTEALTEAKRYGKIPLLRIYAKDRPRSIDSDFLDSAVILAKGRGYEGITLGGTAISPADGLEIRQRLMLHDLLLFVERELDVNTPCTDYADGTVLTYDKLHLSDIPSFADGEERALRSYADRCTVDTAFLELSPFALAGDKYVEKSRAYSVADRNHGSFNYDPVTKLLTGTIGRGRRERPLISESLENTKSKLELIGELGFMGIAFDIMRAPLNELLIFSNMFKTHPSTRRGPICNPPN